MCRRATNDTFARKVTLIFWRWAKGNPQVPLSQPKGSQGSKRDPQGQPQGAEGFPRRAKGRPRDSNEQPKGAKGSHREPRRDAKGTQRQHEGTQSEQGPRGSQRCPKDGQGKAKRKDIYPKLPINRQSGRYVTKKMSPRSNSTLQFLQQHASHRAFVCIGGRAFAAEGHCVK